MKKEEIINKVITLAKQKKYLEKVADKQVYEWIDKYNLYEELDIPDPKKDEAL